MVNLLYIVYALSAVAGVQACETTCSATGDSGSTCSYICNQACPDVPAHEARNNFLAALQSGGHSCSAVGASGVRCQKTDGFGSCYDHYWLCGDC
ncbi:hypothetical protein BFJ69_g17396 [Fusarium oxysporum]|uniref:Uncharacterized protein n=1 Tax=Fusarium oxysporum TaxID=5507 RepID=A0A420M8D0_FUSOX|nr:hypothetical protein BFJ69_g17396 [Fusarium oxysporum]